MESSQEPDGSGVGPTLVCAGRLEYQKGYDLLLEAVALLRARWPRILVRILGEGSERASLEAQRARLGLSDHVRFEGFKDNPWAEMSGADLFVLPSRYEGFSNVLLEALALGLPSIVSDGPGGADEIVRPGADGELFTCGDVEALADAIDRGLRRKADEGFPAIGAELEARVGMSTIISQYEDLIADLAASRAGARRGRSFPGSN